MELQPSAIPSSETEVTAADPKSNPNDKMQAGSALTPGDGFNPSPSPDTPDDNDEEQDENAKEGQPNPGEKSEKEQERTPMEELVKILSQGADTQQSPQKDSMKNESGYDQLAKQNNGGTKTQGSPEVAEEAAETAAQNPEIVAAAL